MCERTVVRFVLEDGGEVCVRGECWSICERRVVGYVWEEEGGEVCVRGESWSSGWWGSCPAILLFLLFFSFILLFLLKSYFIILFCSECTACWLIFVTFNISVMVSNFGFGWEQVPCYLSVFMTFKCYYCHVFIMCSFNTWMKLSAEYWSQFSLSWEVTLSSKFGMTDHSISEPIAERRTSYRCTRDQQSVVGRLENPCCLWM